MSLDEPEMDPMVSEAVAVLAERMAPSRVVTRAGTMLRMAQQGLRDIQESNEDRIVFGFLGIVVFGRTMTFVMQNLRRHDGDAFARWYAPWQREMKADSLMRYFSDLRTMVIHHDAPLVNVLIAGCGAEMPPIGSITIDGLPLPERHLGQVLEDTSMVNLCRLYVTYLERLFESFAPVAFALEDRLIVPRG